MLRKNTGRLGRWFVDFRVQRKVRTFAWRAGLLVGSILLIALLASLTASQTNRAQSDLTASRATQSLPVRELRRVIPFGKDDASFSIILPELPEADSGPATPIQVRLKATKAPKLNEPIQVSIEIYAFKDAPGTAVELRLPEGARVAQGPAQATVDLKADQIQTVTTEIAFTKLGLNEIHAVALKAISEDEVWGDMDSLYFTVGKDSGKLGYPGARKSKLATGQTSPDLAPESKKEKKHLEEPTRDEQDQLLNQPEGASVSVTISICWVLGSDRDGSVPAFRDAKIELWDDDAGADDLLNSWYTDFYNGCRSVTVSNTDVDEGGTIDVFFRVFTDSSGRWRIQNYGGGLFYCQTSTANNIAANYSFGTWWCGGGAGNDRSVRLSNDLYRLWRFLWEQSVASGMGGMPGQVTVRWQSGGTDGDYYRFADGLVHLSDSAANVRDIVTHEAGHRYMHLAYAGFPPNDCPSPHYIQYVSGRYCGWTEGYTYVLVAGADGNPVYSWPSGASLNLETPNCSTAGWDDGPRVEGRVGGVLIDMLDPFALSFGGVAGFGNEGWVAACGGDDSTTGMFDAVWDLFYDQNDNLIVSQGGDVDSFSNAWESRQYPRFAPHRAGHLNSIDTFTHD